MKLFCMKPIRPVPNCSFYNQDFDWNAMLEGDMSGLWLFPESIEEWTLTFNANERPLEKWSGILLDHVVHGSFSREGMKVAFLKDGKEEP